MSAAARSIYVFGVYLVVLGGILIGSPNTLLALVQLPPTDEPWIHVAGVPVMAIGIFHVVSGRAELVPFFRTSVWVRFGVLTSFAVMAAIGMVPLMVVGFGLVDALGAVWTRAALRAPSVPATHSA